MARLQDRVAFITGAGSGIGRGQARLFANEGASVIVADLDGDKAEAVAQEVRASGGRAVAVTVDVTDTESVAAAVARGNDEYGVIDILSNTAGMFDDFAQSLDTPMTLWDKVVAVNLTSMLIVCNAILPQMMEKGAGAVVNIASGAGLRGGGGGAAYTSTKHGVIGFTRQLAVGYGPHGIRVNAIAPGLIDTPMVADFSSLPETHEGLAQQPAGRMGRVEDIAYAALFLVSDESDFIHAVTLPVDGGLINTL